MNLRAIIAMSVCLSLLGTSIAPASMLPCCCSSKKAQSKCCSLPLVEDNQKNFSCCPVMGGTFRSESAIQNHFTKPCGEAPTQTAVKCMCSSHNKPPILNVSNLIFQLTFHIPSLTSSTQEVLVDYYNYCSLVSQTQFSPNIPTIFKSCSLRI